MEPINYFQEVNTLIQSLQQTKGIVTTQTILIPGPGLQAISNLQTKLNITLPPEVANFYAQIEYARLLWEMPDTSHISPIHTYLPNVTIRGGFEFIRLTESIQGPKGYPNWKGIIWTEDMHPADLNEFTQYKPFYFNPWDEAESTSLSIQNNHLLSHQTHFINNDGAPFDLNLSFTQYFRLIITTKAFINRESAYLFQQSPEYHQLTQYLPQAFPNINLSPFF